MATQPIEDQEDDTPIEDVEDEPEGDIDATPEPDEGDEDADEEADQPDVNDDAEDYTFGDEVPEDEEAGAPQWAKDLRKRYREVARENAELKKAKAPEKIEVGPMPRIDDEGIDYDPEIHAARLTAWLDQKALADEQNKAANAVNEAREQAWQGKVNRFAEQRTVVAAKVPDYEDRELKVAETLSPDQHKLIVGGAKNAAGIIAALGRNDAELKRVAAIGDNVEFAFEIGRMEATLKARKPETSPERAVRGGAPSEPGKDATLARLEKQAASGDRTALIAYKAKMRK